MAKRMTKKQKRINEIEAELVIGSSLSGKEFEKFKMRSLFAKAMSSNPKKYVFLNQDGGVNMEQSDQDAIGLYHELRLLKK